MVNSQLSKFVSPWYIAIAMMAMLSPPQCSAQDSGKVCTAAKNSSPGGVQPQTGVGVLDQLRTLLHLQGAPQSQGATTGTIDPSAPQVQGATMGTIGPQYAPQLQGATMGTIGPQYAPQLQGATMGTIGPQYAPQLQGATMGTIGPQSTPELQGATMGTIGPQCASQLQGATMGTIGPQGTEMQDGRDAFGNPLIQVTVAGTPRVSDSFLPGCSTAYILAIGLVSSSVFMFIRLKRSSMWEMGIVASVIVTLTGVVAGYVFFH